LVSESKLTSSDSSNNNDSVVHKSEPKSDVVVNDSENVYEIENSLLQERRCDVKVIIVWPS
jgi:hypothetical protein